MQSRACSFLESVCNTALGYIVALCSQLVIFPFFNIHVSLRSNMMIGAWFTVISIARGYVVRRMWTRRTEA